MYYLEEMCYLCLKHQDLILVNFHSKRDDNFTHFQKISNFLPNISSAFELDCDNMICEKCSETLESIYSFIENCQKSMKTLNSYKSILKGGTEKKRCCVKVELEQYPHIKLEPLSDFSSNRNINNEIKLMSKDEIKTEVEDNSPSDALTIHENDIKIEIEEMDMELDYSDDIYRDLSECKTDEMNLDCCKLEINQTQSSVNGTNQVINIVPLSTVASNSSSCIEDKFVSENDIKKEVEDYSLPGASLFCSEDINLLHDRTNMRKEYFGDIYETCLMEYSQNPSTADLLMDREEMKNKFYENLGRQFKNINSFLMTFQKYLKLVEEVKEAKSRKNKKNRDYWLLKHYDSIQVNGKDRLISPIIEDRILYYVPQDVLFDILYFTHVSVGHGGRDKMRKELSKQYKNITIQNIQTFLNLCELCLQKKKSKLLVKIGENPSKSNDVMKNIADQEKVLEEHNYASKENSSEHNEPDAQDLLVPIENSSSSKLFQKTFELERKLLTQHHTEGTPYTCNLCNESFIDINTYYTHKRSHLRTKPYKCTICKKIFKQLKNLILHERSHTGDKPYSCDICKQSFCHINNLHLHKRIHTEEKPESYKPLKCEVNEEEWYTCNVCEKRYKLGDLVVHKCLLTAEQSYACDLCEKSFPFLSHLLIHKRTHSKESVEKPYSCDVCGKSFRHKSHLASHKYIHTGVKPYPCMKCNKAFVKNADLVKHLRTHSSKRSYTCHICKKSYKHISRLISHKQLHTGERSFTCDICNKSFCSQLNLNKHKFLHMGDKPYSCDMCEKSFTTKALLDSHKVTHTGNQPFSCTLCKKSFSYFTCFARHIHI